MATNPMQRKARNSFLLGMLTMLLISALIIGLLVMQLINMKEKEKKEEESYKDVYVLAQDVKSGESISMDKLQQMQAVGKVVPSNIFVTSDWKEDTVAKINMGAGTILSKEMVSLSGEKVTDDLRSQEYNMLTLPTEIVDGDYIDVRLRLPSGADYIVVSKKSVTIPKLLGVDSEDTVILNMTEAEIITMSNAIVEAYIMKGSELYVSKYVDPGMQKTSTSTYPVSAEVMGLINSNRNIVDEARRALWDRYNTEQRNNSVNKELGNFSEEAKTNVETNIESQITRQKETRKKYLESLSGGATTY